MEKAMDKKVSFDIVKNKLETMFNGQIQDKWDLTPDNIGKFLANIGIELEWKKIENWEKFEIGKHIIPNGYFINLLFSGADFESGNVFIITEECFKDKMAHCIESNKLTGFIDSYKNNYGMDFFQPFDYIFIFYDKPKIVLLHHGGYYSEYKK
jgi:hypothetical protein